MKLRKLFMLLVFVFLIIIHIDIKVNAETNENHLTKIGGVEYILSEIQIENYLKQKYNTSDTKFESATRKNEYVLSGVKNASQYSLNKIYKRERDIDVEGTCSIVAISILLDYYNRQGKLGEVYNLSIEDWFVKTMDIALANDLTTRDNGTLVTNVDNIITKVFNSMDIQLKGNNDYYYIKSSIRSIVTNDRPFILHIPSHSTVAKGYVTYEVKYQEKYWSWFKYKWRTVTKIEEFAVISEGWGHSTPRYYDIELIDDVFPNLGDYVMTKIVKS